MQAWPLSRKIQVTQTRIIEWYIKNKGQVYVSFSGGKDSTVLLDLARRIYPDIPAVFVDTGLEYPEIREFVKSIDSVTWLRPKMNFRKVIETYGYPLVSKEISEKIYFARKGRKEALMAFEGKTVDGTESKYRQRYKKWRPLCNSNVPISHKCCEVMKKEPAKAYEKETGRKPILATMAVESTLRVRSWLQNGCNAFTAKRPSSQPMSFWTEQDVLEYIKTFGVAYASVYPMLKEALKVIEAWGFKYKSIGFQWVKQNRSGNGYFFGLGRWTRGNTEPCLIAVKGKPHRASNSVSQLIFAPLRAHSQKPDITRDKIRELMGGDHSYIELFARNTTPGWDVWGNEVNKYGN